MTSGYQSRGLKVLKVKKDEQSPSIAPSDKTVKDGTYPLSRPLFFHARGDLKGTGKAFIDWVLSPQGQGIAVKVGYFPIK